MNSGMASTFRLRTRAANIFFKDDWGLSVSWKGIVPQIFFVYSSMVLAGTAEAPTSLAFSSALTHCSVMMVFKTACGKNPVP